METSNWLYNGRTLGSGWNELIIFWRHNKEYSIVTILHREAHVVLYIHAKHWSTNTKNCLFTAVTVNDQTAAWKYTKMLNMFFLHILK